jgi:acetate kinase
MSISGASHLLAINAGSSSIKFALFQSATVLLPVFDGEIRGIGSAQSCFVVHGTAGADTFEHRFAIPEPVTAVHVLVEWLAARLPEASLAAIVHRVVHGGARYVSAQAVDRPMLAALHDLASADPEHMPQEIRLIETLRHRYPGAAHIACFDSAFHATMPEVASMIAIPRRYYDLGIRRLGYHGLSCSYLMRRLHHVAGAAAASGKVVLAHLGGGASITAVEDGRSRDTTMGLTPAGGIAMGHRSGDIDPGLALYCARHEHMSEGQFNHMLNYESGLAGVSGTSGDLQDLIAHEAHDVRAAQAVALFCYQARKAICAMAGAIEGIDTLVFSGGIGENSATARARICAGLAHIGVVLDPLQNLENAAVISSHASPVQVRVMRTDEQWMLAEEARLLLARSSCPDTESAAHA